MKRATSRIAMAAVVLTATTALIGTPAYAVPTSIIINQWSALCMDAPGNDAPANGAQLQQYICNTTITDNQLWYVESTEKIGENQMYWIRNAKGDKCVDLPGTGTVPEGTHVQMWTCALDASSDNQEWYQVSNGNVPGAVIWVNRANLMCLDVAGTAGAPDNHDLLPGQSLTVWTCTNRNWANFGYDDHLWG